MTREVFDRELTGLRESVLRMASKVEAQILQALAALRSLDRQSADEVWRNDQSINELLRQIRDQVFLVIATQQPVARDLRTLVGVQNIATELERIGDYAVRIARRTIILAGLPSRPMRPEFAVMGDLATQQVRNVIEALVADDEERAREVAARDDDIDQLYQRVFHDLVFELGTDSRTPDDALRLVTLTQIAHNMERIGDRVANVAEDIVFLESGHVVELG